jgi:hypothetical protein
MQSSASSKRRPRSASRERDPPSAVAEADDDHEERRAVATMRRMSASTHKSRAREVSPRPRSMGDLAHKELYVAIPSLQTGGAHLESFNRRTHVRTVVTKKHEWTYGEIHELSRVTTANNRLSARWDFDHASLVIDWWSADRPRRDLCTPQRGSQQQPCALSREVLDVITKARCSDKVYILVIDAVSLLYQVCPGCHAHESVQLAQLQGDESPRDLRFAVKNSGPRIEITTSGWKKMLLADVEMIRVRVCVCASTTVTGAGEIAA